MGTLGRTTRNGKKSTARRVEHSERSHPAVAKLAVALREYKEAVEQQAATAEILRSLSQSSADPRPVFEAIVENAHRLCRAAFSVLYTYDGKQMDVVADRNVRKASRALRTLYPAPPSADHIVGRTILERRTYTAVLPDDPRFPGNRNAFGKVMPRRVTLAVPLMKNDVCLGAIATARIELKPYSRKEIGLLQTFADQAVIAMENVRLFNETKEALEHQKASADILRIIAGSVESTAPVFEAITAAGTRLVAGSRVALFLERDGQLHYASHSGIANELRTELAKRWPAALDRQVAAGAAILDKRVIHISDMLVEGGQYPRSVEIARASGYRALLCVPLVRGRKAIGCISFARVEAGAYTEKQITLAKTFADQAVIAIRNAGQFREIQERNAELRQSLDFQGASGEILASISSSIADTQPVFDAIVRNLMRLLGTEYAAVTLLHDKQLELAAFQGGPGTERVRDAYPVALAGEEHLTARAIVRRQVVQVAPIVGNPEAPPATEKLCRVTGYQSAIAAPMIRGGEVIGAIAAARLAAQPFDDKQVALIKAFADQAVIAIENARLFNETKEALERQTATAEILRVISSTPTDTQPVFDAIVTNAQRIIAAKSAALLLRRAQEFFVAAYSIPGLEEMPVELRSVPLDRDKNFPSRVILNGEILHIPDWEANEIPEHEKVVAKAFGFGSGVQVPLMRKDEGIGALVVSRATKGPFSEKEIALLQSFADQAVIAIENTRLFRELQERNAELRQSLDFQAATSEILASISSSIADTQPVFDAIVRNLRALFGDGYAAVFLARDGRIEVGAVHGDVDWERFREVYPIPLDERTAMGQAMVGSRVIHYTPVRGNPAVPALTREIAQKYPFDSMLCAPMVREGKVVGGIAVTRREAASFDDKEIALINAFAAQAVIAIENARLFNETKQALERQTATAEILGVLGGSMSDPQPVFDAIVNNCHRLFEGSGVALRLISEDGRLHVKANIGYPAEPVPIERTSAVGACVLDGRAIHFPDLDEAAKHFPRIRQLGLKHGYRSGIYAPLMRGGKAIGAMSVMRRERRAFNDNEIRLLNSFTDQAVIAIENARLFNETKEALERQTATAGILRVISGTQTDTQPVFDAIVRSGLKVFAGTTVAMSLAEGDQLRVVASGGDLGLMPMALTVPRSRESATGTAVSEGVVVNIKDTEGPDVPPHARDNGRRLGFRAIAAAPMVREGKSIGAITVMQRTPSGLSDKQLELLKTFADQAVIAIENVRLFNETREALERQTATAEILKVISSSTTDTQPTLDAIAATAHRLFGVTEAGIVLLRNGRIELAATCGLDPARVQAMRSSFPRQLGLDSTVNHVVEQGIVVHLPDTESADVPATTRRNTAAVGVRAVLGVPMLREGNPIGGIFVSRLEPGRFSDKQVALLQTFADQAVIAIENVRLFNETKESLERQTATAEILKVISSSPTDVQPVFAAIARSAVALCGALFANVFRYDGKLVHYVASEGLSAEGIAIQRRSYPMPPDRSSVSGRVILGPSVERMEDSQKDPAYNRRFITAAGGARRMIGVPMLREGRPLGAIVVAWPSPGPIAPAHEHLLTTFADQAAIAIENVRLFNELRSRTEALGKSVQELTALGEVGQAIGSTLELETVLKTIVTHAVKLTGLDAGVIYEYDEALGAFELRASENFDEESVAGLREAPIRRGEGAVGRAVATRAAAAVPDTHAPEYPARLRELLDRQGFRAVLAVPLVREEHTIGALMVLRKSPGPFAPEIVELLGTLASQSALAIQNARLFREIEDKGRQLESASRHKSQFLASMSHELRTPLNAILGFNEMIIDQVYGDVPEDMKSPLENIQSSGKHLLRLINNVLDLAKIEAGRMELALSEYLVQETVASVHTTLKPLAVEKGLEFVAEVPADIPPARGDPGRLAQCLMNLAGNSLKFTKEGRVAIGVAQHDGLLRFSVADTGIGIPPEKIASLFTEFKQTDATIASEYGGTGLGLSITKKFIEMHGGRIWVESEPGKGSTFLFEIPMKVAR